MPLVEEVRLAVEEAKEQVGRFGPGLTQSALLILLDLRLPEWYAHALRVARSSVAMARAMGLPEGDVRDVRRAALLHDIGLIAIPDRILRPHGQLSEDELTARRMHVTIGADLLAGVPSLSGVAMMIAATHERSDGSGYPDGASAGDIPLGARIIAVADCYDAMVSRRPCREPLTHEEAYHEMVRRSGSHFDPSVVRAWMAMVGTIGPPAVSRRPRGDRRNARPGVVVAGRFDMAGIRPPA
jgi:putative nucleotidyltransferase with HDIG domain